MNKFLKLTFKIGKVFSSILLVIVLLVMVGSGIALLTSDNAPLKTPSFNTLKQTFIEENAKYEENNNTSTNNSNTQQSKKISQYAKQIEKIIRKHHLNEEVKYLISDNIDRNINTELIGQYLKGLDKFYTDGLRYINKSEDYKDDLIFDAVYAIEGQYQYKYHLDEARNNVKVAGIYNYYVSAGLAMKYHDLFINSLRDKAERLQEKAMNKIAQQIVFAVSILIFSILLFLPVLIKIEENTRPVEEREEEKTEVKKKEEETKTCKNCGKKIKVTAKKCRYCGTWQEETE